MNKIAVLVTTFNGLDLLQKHLPEVIKHSPEAQTILVADDCSDDDTASYISQLAKKHPKLHYLRQKTNQRFAINSNLGVSRLKDHRYCLLLNNDIRPQPNYISKSVRHFLTHPKLLGVSLSEIVRENWARLLWKSGYLQYQGVTPTDSRPHINGWISGGSSIIDIAVFRRLGGFDPIYSPFYSEDVDLGYRAWKSGYQCLYDPQSQVHHYHASTNNRFSRHFLDYVKERNRLLTVWRNITDPAMLFSHRLTLISRVLTGPNYLKIILAARKSVSHSPPPIVFPQRTDRQIFDLFAKP